MARGNPRKVGDFARVTSQELEQALEYLQACEQARKSRQPLPPTPTGCRVALDFLNQVNKAHGHMPHTAYAAKQARKRATALTRLLGNYCARACCTDLP